MQTASDIDRMVERGQRNELNRFLAAEHTQEIRAEQIEQRAKSLMRVGEEYHPWSFENFEEAIGNAPDAERKVMFATIAEAVASGLKNDHCNHMALVAIRQMNERYWTKLAVCVAERDD
jgi:hypothetical protein